MTGTAEKPFWQQLDSWDVVKKSMNWEERREGARQLYADPTSPELLQYLDDALAVESDNDGWTTLVLARTHHQVGEKVGPVQVFLQSIPRTKEAWRNDLVRSAAKLAAFSNQLPQITTALDTSCCGAADRSSTSAPPAEKPQPLAASSDDPPSTAGS